MKKKAEDLKPGDILQASAAYGSRIVLAVEPSVIMEGMLAVKWYGVKTGAVDMTTLEPGYHIELEVESPTLTPAQQHAEELLRLARIVAEKSGVFDDQRLARALLARIDPPKPPSAEELAAMLLVAWREGHAPQGTSDLLERARAAGMLKDPQ